ncbi:MAG: hypothetical protein MUP58_03075 [Candidatus Nanohaloarchaeota archaeon QJJ-9]|nr:hypothetical protein [Candidatus Nanohaloarchaeota archaeon QJJ-9]
MPIEHDSFNYLKNSEEVSDILSCFSSLEKDRTAEALWNGKSKEEVFDQVDRSEPTVRKYLNEFVDSGLAEYCWEEGRKRYSIADLGKDILVRKEDFEAGLDRLREEPMENLLADNPFFGKDFDTKERAFGIYGSFDSPGKVEVYHLIAENPEEPGGKYQNFGQAGRKVDKNARTVSNWFDEWKGIGLMVENREGDYYSWREFSVPGIKALNLLEDLGDIVESYSGF